MIKMLYCDYCGEELGEGERWPGEYMSCGKKECEREIRYMYQSDEAEARERAEMDDYSRYR